MGIHKQLCLKKNPNLAVWAAIFFGVYGLTGLINLHDKIDVGLIARVAYLVIAGTFIGLLAIMTCAVERALCLLFFAIFAIDLLVAFLRLESSNQIFLAKATITSIWFLMAVICAIWAMRAKRST